AVEGDGGMEGLKTIAVAPSYAVHVGRSGVPGPLDIPVGRACVGGDGVGRCLGRIVGDGVHRMISPGGKEPMDGDIHVVSVDGVGPGVLLNSVVLPLQRQREGGPEFAVRGYRGAAVVIDHHAKARMRGPLTHALAGGPARVVRVA